MRNLRLLIAVLLTTLLSACTDRAAQPTVEADPSAPRTTTPRTLTVFAAASLGEAFEALGQAFMASNQGVTVTINAAGSQQLATQINGGAPADVFASANQRQMDVVVGGGRVAATSAQVFARNRLVLIAPSNNPAGIQVLADLAKPGLRLVLADKAVPAGQYTLDMLQAANALPAYTTNFSATVLANVVSYEENVRAVLTKVQLGEADAGVVYSSDIARDRASVTQIAIPDALNPPARYQIAPLSDSPNVELAAAFVAYALSPAGQAILQDYGFLAADG